MRGFFHGESDLDENERDSEEPRLRSVSLSEGAYAIGRKLADLAVGPTGAEVTAIRRRDVRTQEPSGDTLFENGDVVVLLGGPEALALAEEKLLKG